MRLPRTALALLAPAGLVLTLALAGPGLVLAQDQPLAAGSEGVPVPKKKKHVQPVYPPEALAQGVRGIVILDLVIDEDGRVAETFIVRSIPGLDEAALVAARQWRYEPVEVDGRPVRVRLTVPITFALRLPEMSRDRGIPELRQGVNPPWPDDGRGGGLAVADVTLEPDGRIRLARILEGDEPWSTALLQALRTWRFRAPPEDVTVSFRVAADFVPEKENGRVELRLTGLRETSLLDSPSAPPAVASAATMPVAADEPAEAGAAEAPEAETSGSRAAAGEDVPPEAPDGPVEGPAAPTEGPPPAGPDVPTTGGEPPQVADAGVPPSIGAASLPEGAQPAGPAPAPSEPAGEAPAPGPVPASPPGPSAPGPSGAGGPAPTPEATQTADEGAPGPSSAAPPPVEVLTVAPPPPPPENGISAIRGVDLEPGVPDLTRGRRPVSPPFARMEGASGEVTVEFSVGAGGLTAVQRVDGPEVFQPAARQAVESWIFRRTRADRAYLVAVFTYEDDLASAVVRPQPAR